MAAMVEVHSVSGERFAQVIKTDKHQFMADEPETYGGSDLGPGPYDYLLAALGT